MERSQPLSTWIPPILAMVCRACSQNPARKNRRQAVFIPAFTILSVVIGSQCCKGEMGGLKDEIIAEFEAAIRDKKLLPNRQGLDLDTLIAKHMPVGTRLVDAMKTLHDAGLTLHPLKKVSLATQKIEVYDLWATSNSMLQVSDWFRSAKVGILLRFDGSAETSYLIERAGFISYNAL